MYLLLTGMGRTTFGTKVETFQPVSCPVAVDNIAAGIVLLQTKQVVERHTEDPAKKHPIHPGMRHQGNTIDPTAGCTFEYRPGAAKDVGKAFAAYGPETGEVVAPRGIFSRKTILDLGDGQAFPLPQINLGEIRDYFGGAASQVGRENGGAFPASDKRAGKYFFNGLQGGVAGEAAHLLSAVFA